MVLTFKCERKHEIGRPRVGAQKRLAVEHDQMLRLHQHDKKLETHHSEVCDQVFARVLESNVFEDVLADDVVAKFLLLHQQNRHVFRKLIEKAHKRFGALDEVLYFAYVHLFTLVERHFWVRIKLAGEHAIAVISVVCTHHFPLARLAGKRLLALQSCKRVLAL